MSETVTIYLWEWTWVKMTLKIRKVEGERTARQIRVPDEYNARSYTIIDPDKAHYTLEAALANMQAVIDVNRKHAEAELTRVHEKQRLLDEYRQLTDEVQKDY